MQRIKSNHLDNCSCPDCLEDVSSRKYNPAIQSRQNMYDNADPEIDSNPGFYIGATLKALKKVDLWTLPGASLGGNVVRSVQPGQTVGIVDTFVKDKLNPSQIWWRFNDGTYTPHFTGYFDKQLAVSTSSGQAFNDSMKAANSTNLNPLPALKGIFNALNIKWILIGIVVVVVGIVIIKLK